MINLFFSYSHKDEDLRNELDKHLSILKRNGIISAWHDRCILPGADIDHEINLNLKKADIVLLLISSDFLSSDYCYDKEMAFALERHEKKEIVVIPIILRPCDWKNSPFKNLLVTPTDGKAVVKYPTLDDAFLDIVTQIRKVASAISTTNYSETDQGPQNEIRSPIVRSSNLRIKKEFSDNDRDNFLDEAFSYIANYFEGSLKELKNRNPEITFRFNRIDSQTFTASVYVHGGIKSECMIYYGAGSFNPKSISYSRNIASSKSSYNESVNVESDGYLMYLKSSGISMYGNNNSKEEKLTNEGASDYFWEILIKPLQMD